MEMPVSHSIYTEIQKKNSVFHFKYGRFQSSQRTDQAPTLYDVVSKEEIAEFEELMRKTIADIVSEASSESWVFHSLRHTSVYEEKIKSS